VNASAQGKVYPDVRVTVSPERVEAFSRAVGQIEPGVPPTFVTVAEFAAMPAIVSDQDLDLDFTKVLHTEQSYGWKRPLEVGETITVRSTIESIRIKGGNGFVTILTELRGEDGEVAVVARSTMLERA